MKILYALGTLLLSTATAAFGSVNVSSPSNGATVGSSAQFTASATSPCRYGVAAMGVYVDNRLAFSTQGASLNTSIALAAGSHNTYVQEWDNCGGSTGTPVTVNAAAQDGVFVTTPADNTTVPNTVGIVASATTGCNQGIAAVGVYANDQLVAMANGSSFNQSVTLNSGPQKTVVQAWDNCGGTTTKQINLTVQGGNPTQTPANVTSIAQIQSAPNWNQWGELAPIYDVCSPCAGVNWNMTQNVSSPSLSGHATRFDVGGSVPYSDVLWSNKIIGQGSTLNLPDNDHKILPAIQNLEYDADVFVANFGVTQDLEFDVNIYRDGIGMEWGTECNHLADGDWDIWDNVGRHWVATGAPCSLNDNAWNHVSIDVQKISDQQILYKTITVNGTTFNINRTSGTFGVASGWYGMTVNYQMDGNYRMASNTTFVDNLTVRYW